MSRKKRDTSENSTAILKRYKGERMGERGVGGVKIKRERKLQRENEARVNMKRE